MKAMAYGVMTMVVAVAMIGLAIGCQGCHEKSNQGTAEKAGTAAPAKTAAGAAGEIAQKLCPVTGEKIDPNIYVDYQGKRIYFCCAMCPPMFQKDPEKYMKKLQEPMSGAAPAAPSDAIQAADITYTCPMHSDVKSDKPGKCPKCGMALVPASSK